VQGARDYFKAIEYYDTQLAIAQELGYGEGIAHGGLGIAYQSLGK
jgi:hypothetical protein